MATNGQPRLVTPVRPANPVVSSELNRNVPPKQAPPPSIPPPPPVIPTSLLQPNEQRLLFVSLFGLLEVRFKSSLFDCSWVSERLRVEADPEIGLQGVGHCLALHHNTGSNMVQLPPPHLPTLGHDMDGRRTSHHPLSRFTAHTPTLTFVVYSQRFADHRGAGSLECGVLGRQ